MNIRLRRQEKRHRPVPPMESDNNNNSCTTPMYPHRKTAAENLLYSEDDKSDYEWLVTPPGSPSGSVTNQFDAPDATNPMTLISLLENYSKGEWHNISPKSQTMSLHNSSSVAGISRPSSSSSSRSTSKPPTPTRRSITSAKRVSTPTKHATLTTARDKSTSSSTIGPRSTSRPSSSSGTSRANLTAARVTRPAISTGQPTHGSSAFTRASKRPISAPNSKPGSRSSTPTRRPSTPTTSSTVLRNKPGLSQGASLIVRSRPWEPYDMPGFSLEAPSNLRTTLPDRPQTALSSKTRVFCASSSKRSASIERNVVRRQSCSPSRNRASIGNVNGAVPSLRGGPVKKKNVDGKLTGPVAKGNQKVERFVNMRKIGPPRLTQTGSSSSEKSISGSEGFGYGRNLSKGSIDMALRHMDVRRGRAGNIRPSMTKVPATSSYSVRSRRNRPTSSSGSSESSVNILCLDGGDDNLSDKSYSNSNCN